MLYYHTTATGPWVSERHDLTGGGHLRVRARHEATDTAFRGTSASLVVTASLSPRRDITTVFVDMPTRRAGRIGLHIEFDGPDGVTVAGDVERAEAGSVECRIIKLPCPRAIATKTGFWGRHFCQTYRYEPAEYAVTYCARVEDGGSIGRFEGRLIVPTVYPWMSAD